MNRNKKYFAGKKLRRSNAEQQDLVKKSNDNKIDQDFPGFPHGHASEKIIRPENDRDKKTADLYNRDGEKINYTEEENSDGSASAFSATEEVRE